MMAIHGSLPITIRRFLPSSKRYRAVLLQYRATEGKILEYNSNLENENHETPRDD